jgi:hypothetical protein
MTPVAANNLAAPAGGTARLLTIRLSAANR